MPVKGIVAAEKATEADRSGRFIASTTVKAANVNHSF